MSNIKGIDILQRVGAKLLDDQGGYRERLRANPEDVLREEGLTVPDNVRIVVHENTSNEVHLVLPQQRQADLNPDEVELGKLNCETVF